MDPAAMRQRMEQFQKMMVDRQLERAKLTPAEDAAARKAIETRRSAQQTFTTELNKLQQTANKDTSSDTELQVAFELFQKALKQYRATTAQADKELLQQLSFPAKVRLTAQGVLDNGMPSMMGMGGMGMGRGMMGPGGPGGPGGGFGGGMRGRRGTGNQGAPGAANPVPPAPPAAPASAPTPAQ